MRIVLIGQQAFGESVLKRLQEAGHEVAGVCAPATKEGARPDPLRAAAEAAGLPVLETRRLRRPEVFEQYAALKPDLNVMAFVTDIIRENVLTLPQQGTIQYHPSLLPRHRGIASINWAIIQGDAVTGLTVFWVDEGIDTGPILLQKEVSVGPDDTVGSIYFNKLFPIGVDAMVEAIADNVYNGVLKFTPDLTKIVPDLAAGMPEQPDDKTYVFKITQGIKFQDVQPVGPREFTADDIKYSLERQSTNDPGKFQHAYYFLNKLDSIQVVDKYTVKVVTKSQYAPFLSYIASPWTVMVPHEAVEKFGDLTQNAIGTGPFIFDSWEKNVQTTLHKNPNYFRKDAAGNALPYIDKLVIKYVVDPQAQLNQFIQGNLDAAALQFNYAKQASDSVKGANSQAVPSQFWKEFRTQPWDGNKYQHKAPYTDIRFRQALVQAIDKQEVLDTVYSFNGKGDGILTYGPILPIYKPWALTDELAGFDPKKALDMLKASGVDPNTFTDQIIFANTTSIDQQVGEVILAQLQKNLGLKKVSLMPMELAAYYNKTYAYDYGMSHHTPLNSPDPDESLSSYFGRNGTYYKWGNTQIWDGIDKQAATVDPTARLAVVQDVQKQIVQDFPMAFLYTANLHLFTQPYVKGWFFPQDLYDGRVESVWIDK